MDEINKFKELFTGKPIIGMLHLKGDTIEQTVKRALLELDIFEKHGLAGAIVENYHGDLIDIVAVLKELSKGIKRNIKIGINVLPNEYDQALQLSDEYGADFVQIDYISGKYSTNVFINELDFNETREKYPDAVILGGVWPKYYRPIPGSNLTKDLHEGTKRADAIVVTGAGTGVETPLDKVKEFREILNDFPLIIGAGLDPNNAKEQLEFADGAIVGSCFKKFSLTTEVVDEILVREFMQSIK